MCLVMFLFSGSSIPGASPTQIYQNRLTVLVSGSDLDNVMIDCGNSTLYTYSSTYCF